MAATEDVQRWTRWASDNGFPYPLVLKINEMSGNQTECTVSSLSQRVCDFKRQIANRIGKDPMSCCLKLFAGEKLLQDDADLSSLAGDLAAQQLSLLLVVEDPPLLHNRKRVLKEVMDLQRLDIFQGIAWANPDRCIISINGSANTPYAEGVFDVEFIFPIDYPFEPFRVSFLTRIWAAHIGPAGMKGIKGTTSHDWQPANNMSEVILDICEKMGTPEFILQAYPHEMDWRHLPNPEAAHQLGHNRAQFDAQAREWTRLYARRLQEPQEPEE